MGCLNCKIFHDKCKAECCYVVPIPRITFALNFDKIVRPVLEQVDFKRGMVIPVTETGVCCFLNSDYSCNIYESRPEVCEKFGDESDINMSCAFQNKNGIPRLKKQTQILHRHHKEAFDRMLR